MARILYIEDDANNRMLVRRVLMASGIDVDEADNARDGIQMAKDNPPDLILMDVSMPDMNGLEATGIIKRTPTIDRIPVIALTAHVMQGDKEKTLEAGCDGYISKPIDIDTFLDEIMAYLR